MDRPFNAMKTALRVLTALTDNQFPNPPDVSELKKLAPHLADAPLDELACEVIQQELKRREKARRHAASI